MLEVIVVAAAVGAIPALLLGLARLVLAGGPAPLRPDVWPGLSRDGSPRWDRLVQVALGFGLVVLLLFAGGPGRHDGVFVFLLALAVLGLFLYAWRREFVFLMSLRDDDFPGRFDKLC